MLYLLRNLAALLFYRRPHSQAKPSACTSAASSISDKSTAPTPSYRSRYLLTNLSALVLSGLTLAATIGLLLTQQNRVLPGWHENILLNSVVAWLAAISKLALLIPLAESIHQVKWALFSRGRRRLSDLDLADHASRDPVGAVRWLLTFRGGWASNFGAALVILGVAFEPAMQHLIGYELVETVSEVQRAALAVNTDYSPVRGLDRGLVFATPQAVLAGAYAEILGAATTPSFECSSGSCTFPTTATTVGVCSQCVDITSRLARTCRAVNSTAPFCVGTGSCYTSGQLCTYVDAASNTTAGAGNIFLEVSASGADFQSAGNGMIEIGKNLVNFTAVYIQPGTQDLPDTGSTGGDTRLPLAPGHVPAGAADPARAFQCALSYCEQRIRTAAVAGGVLKEVATVAEDSYETLTMAAPDLANITDALFDSRVNLTSSNTSTQVSVAAVFAMSRGFAASLTGNSTKPVTAIPAPGTVSELHRAWYEKLVDTGFEDVVAAMARSMTAAIRNDGGDTVGGETWVPKMFLRVDWEWIAVPAVVWGGCVLLLVAVTWSARRSHSPWLGSSQVAACFIDLERQVRVEAEQLDAAWGDKHHMRVVAERFNLRVAPVHGLTDGRAKLEFTQVPSPVKG
jgi:hypothetical protein